MEKMDIKALVTGGCGEVGQYVLQAFDCDNYDIKNGDDIFDTDKLVERMKGKDLVVHLAAYAHPFMKGITDADYNHLNKDGTAQVVACMRRAGVKRILFMSTGGVYGFSSGTPHVKYLPIDEEHELAPEDRLTTYDKTKIFCENYLTTQKGIKGYVLRLEAPGVIERGFNVFREHLWAHIREGNFIDLLQRLAKYKGKSDIFNAGDPRKADSCPDTIEFAKREYPDAEIKLKNGFEPLVSVDKARRLLGYASNL